MRFIETPLAGAFLVDIEPNLDARGFFSRMYCSDEFSERGLNTNWPQENISCSISEHTLRGMHINQSGSLEEKTVRCAKGAIHDVIVDLRPDSETRLEWFGVSLTASDYRTLYIPKGFAHGFLTIAPETEVQYRMGAPYQSEAASGFRWNDPLIGIEWPAHPKVISERDATYADVADRLGELS